MVYSKDILIISMGWRGRDVTPLLTHWSGVSHALAHPYVDLIMLWQCVSLFHDMLILCEFISFQNS